VTEAAFTTAVLELAALLRWRSLHVRPGRTQHGWRTPVSGDGKGWPDLLLARPPRIVIAELKVAGGRLSADQQLWISQLEACPQIELHVWTPRDMDEIARVLR
jgi:hypothetical protein